MINAIYYLLILLTTASTGFSYDRGKTNSSSSIQTGKSTLVIGKISSNPKKDYGYLKPMVEYVAKNMADLGITGFGVLMARDNQQMIRYLKDGKVDWVTETIFPAVVMEQEAGAEILLRKWKNGVPKYHTVFITPTDSDIYSLADLKGKVIAFEDPGSTSAYFLPASIILKEGLDLVPLISPDKKPPENAVGFVMAREEINIATWVYRKIVDAGTYNHCDFLKDEHTPLAYRKKIRIFHYSEVLPRAVEIVRKDLNPRIKQRLRQILLHADQDPKAKLAMRKYHKTTKFDEIDERIQKSLTKVRELLPLIRSKIK